MAGGMDWCGAETSGTVITSRATGARDIVQIEV
jgi:hypothetical protein